MARPQKRLTEQEKAFAAVFIEGKEKYTDIARRIFGIRCEPGSIEARRVQSLIRSVAFKDYCTQLEGRLKKEADAETILSNDRFDWDKLRIFAYNALKQIRDDNRVNSNTRFRAIQALEKLADPAQDHNLIYRWLDLAWGYIKAHCPACHQTFPLEKIQNRQLTEWREKAKIVSEGPQEDDYKRRLNLLKRADRRTEPHKGQRIALESKERHIVALGAARGGKSKALAMLATLFILSPGSESWILARVYDDARSEVEYLTAALQTLFYPVTDQMISTTTDSKSGEIIITTKWGAEFRVRSAKSKGSITGRELDAVMAAEPGWLSDDIYEEVRARISSRLGRIFAFGTPKGMGGFLGRIVNLTGRDPKTGKILRIPPEQRTIAAGMAWVSSILVYTMDPKDNPAYVKAEIDAARMELSDAEFASEFQGKMVADEGAKFPMVTKTNLRPIEPSDLNRCVYSTGIDQGERNFGCVVVGWDFNTAYVIYEYFDNSNSTIKANMMSLMEDIPYRIRKAGGRPDHWAITTFDQDPPVFNILDELEEEGKKWPTEVTYRHRNQLKKGDNWRAEVTEFINDLASMNRLVFDPMFADLLHEQLMRVLNAPPNSKSDAMSNSKGWIVSDPWRSDHVLDAFLLAMWAIYSNSIIETEKLPEKYDIYELARKSLEFEMKKAETRELTGFASPDQLVDEPNAYKQVFGRSMPGRPNLFFYPDEG